MKYQLRWQVRDWQVYGAATYLRGYVTHVAWRVREEKCGCPARDFLILNVWYESVHVT